MQTPEKIAIIGGSILLSSTLVFGLKAGATTIAPKIYNSIDRIEKQAKDIKSDSDFNSEYQRAQQEGMSTGHLGSAEYYIDKGQNLYVGKGQLNDTIYNSLGGSIANNLRSINFTNDIQAPASGRGLFAQLSNIEHINGYGKIDFSNTQDTGFISNSDSKLRDVDVTNAQGRIGSTPYRIDGNNNLYLGQGTIDDTIYDKLGEIASNKIQSVSFTQPVQITPSASRGLLAQLSNVTQVNGYSKVQFSPHSDKSFMTTGDNNLKNVDISNGKGTWGTAPYNIDEKGNMYVGKGKLDDTLYNSLTEPIASHIKSLNFTQPVQVESSASRGLLAQLYNATDINGYGNVTMDPHSDKSFMTTGDNNLKNVDISNGKGTWGTAPYNIDEKDNMYVGKGKLDDTLYNSLTEPIASHIKSLNFTQPVQVESSASRGLLAQLYNATDINGYGNVTMDPHSDKSFMTAEDSNLKHVDVSNSQGSWGTAPYHIDQSGNMYVGEGDIDDTLLNDLSEPLANNIRSVHFTAPVKVAPSASRGLLAQLYNATDISGYGNVNLDSHSDQSFMFAGDNNLSHIDNK